MRHRTTPEQVEACIARNPHKPGAAKLRRALGSDVTLSILEDAFLELLTVHDLPLPRTNIDLEQDKVDCHWPQLDLTIELVSYRYHATRHAFETDVARRRRSNHLAYTYGDVVARGRADGGRPAPPAGLAAARRGEQLGHGGLHVVVGPAVLAALGRERQFAPELARVAPRPGEDPGDAVGPLVQTQPRGDVVAGRSARRARRSGDRTAPARAERACRTARPPARRRRPTTRPARRSRGRGRPGPRPRPRRPPQGGAPGSAARKLANQT